jgi:chemotaxis protein methyltransferase CheR
MMDAIDEFRALLTARFGWRLDDDRGQVAQWLSARSGRGRSAEAYVAALRQAAPPPAEVRAIADAFAVSETYFFRNPEQFAVLADTALPTVAARKPAGPIRILSAGAASGEEAYSIAMTIARVRARQPLPPVEILGVDVSPRAIDKARRGRYSAWALRGLPADLRHEFFDCDGRHFDVKPAVARMVRFEQRNLVDGLPAGPWDIVFFRNTLMYFTPDTARRLIARVADAMSPDAFLFLGHAETLRGLSDRFALQHSHDAFYYRLPGAATAAGDRLAAAPPPAAAAPPPVHAVDDEWFHEIARATERVAALIDGRPRPEGGAAAAPPPSASGGIGDALALLGQERYAEALASLGPGADPDRVLVRAVLLLHVGRVDEADAAARQVLAADSMHAGAQYVLALCAERRGDDAGTVRHDEMAMYLDDTFAMPHLHLALLSRRRGDRAGARRHAQRARDLFAAEDDLRVLLFGNGFTRRALLQLCDAQLQALAS